MQLSFECDVEDVQRGEIVAVLRRIQKGDRPGQWVNQLDEIRFVARFRGGRSTATVFDVVLRTGNHERRGVIKVGSYYDLKGEFQAFRTYLLRANSLFVPIEAASPALLKTGPSPDNQLEAIIYMHVASFAGGYARARPQL